MPSIKRFVATTVALWGLLVLGFETTRIWSVLSVSPSPEYYTHSLSFQLFGSAFLVATKWLPLLLIVIALELLVLQIVKRFARRRFRAKLDGAPPNRSCMDSSRK